MPTVTQQSNNTSNDRATYGGSTFELPDYDTTKIEPDAYEGEYLAQFNSCKWKFTSAQPPRPMIMLEWKLKSTTADDDSDAQKSIGAKVTDYIVLANDRSGNSGKAKLRTLQEVLELDIDFARMNQETVSTLASALKGRTLPIWITNKEEADGNVRTNISYKQPGGGGMLGPMMTAAVEDETDEADPEEEVEARKAKKTSAKKK